MSFIGTAILGSSAIGAGASIFGASEQAGAENKASSTIEQSIQTAIPQLLSMLSQGASGLSSNVATGAGQQEAYTGEGQNSVLSLLKQGVGSLGGYVGSGLSQLGGYTGAGASALSPYASGGTSALSTLQQLLTPGANQTQVLSQLPGFQFQNFWGDQAAQNAGTTRGLGGNVITGAEQFSSGLASGSYNS